MGDLDANVAAQHGPDIAERRTERVWTLFAAGLCAESAVDAAAGAVFPVGERGFAARFLEAQ